MASRKIQRAADRRCVSKTEMRRDRVAMDSVAVEQIRQSVRVVVFLRVGRVGIRTALQNEGLSNAATVKV
jgi:hypothetical protein